MTGERDYEGDIQPEILLSFNQNNNRLFRNNVGSYKIGNRFVRFGLCAGSSDGIGWQTVTITPAMVGKQVAIFTAVEIKRDESELKKWYKSKQKRATQQRKFLQVLKACGGFAIATAGVTHARNEIARLRAGLENHE